LDLIHHTAKQMVGTANYSRHDLRDIEQDLIVDLLERLPKFDPAKATYATFVARVVERKRCNLMRDRQAERRDLRREETSLNDEVDIDDDGPMPLSNAISQDDAHRRMGKQTRSAEERNDLRSDLDSVLADLPPTLRRIAELLQSHSITDVAKLLGIPRGTLRSRHLKQLRTVLQSRGITGYFE
jgi:RNA polymerase sigma-70 factor (ECF subfamily)